MSALGFQNILCEMPVPHVARIAFNRGAEQNPLDLQTCAELMGALQFAGSTSDVRAVVVSHRGPFFCSGGELPSELEPDGRRIGPTTEMLKAFHEIPKPTIAAVDGRVQGSGLAILLACDVAIASLGSSFLVPEARVGLWSFHVLPELVRVLGRRRATTFLLQGAAVNGAEAKSMGLISDVISVGEVETQALAYASKLATMSPTALGLGLTSVREVAGEGASPERLQERLDGLLSSSDAREALASFREHREPVWGKPS